VHDINCRVAVVGSRTFQPYHRRAPFHITAPCISEIPSGVRLYTSRTSAKTTRRTAAFTVCPIDNLTQIRNERNGSICIIKMSTFDVQAQVRRVLLGSSEMRRSHKREFYHIFLRLLLVTSAVIMGRFFSRAPHNSISLFQGTLPYGD
jgi:hypothetical protein